MYLVFWVPINHMVKYACLTLGVLWVLISEKLYEIEIQYGSLRHPSWQHPIYALLGSRITEEGLIAES